MKILLLFLVMASFVLVGCTPSDDDGNTTYPTQLYTCEQDVDCVPKPECHPRDCINRGYTDDFEKPEMCTAIFDCKAAYVESDCACIGERCVNKNMLSDCSTERN